VNLNGLLSLWVVRLGGAFLLNLLLLAALTWLNRTEVVQADPVEVARLRLPELPSMQAPPKELLPKEEPEPEDPVLVDPQQPDPPLAEIEPLALPSVQLGVDVPVVVRAMPVVTRLAPRRHTHRHVARAAPPARRTLGSDEVDEPPRESLIQKPEYPVLALRCEIEGSATVKLLIDEEGRVRKVELVDTRGSRLFGQAVLAVAKSWRFVAAKNHGKRVRVWALKTVRFRLKGRG
jgi:TonB family protein